MTNKINYTHGDAGSQPPDGNEFAANERPDAQHFDWFWSTIVSRVNSLVQDVSDIVSGATQVGDADTVDGQDYTDIQNWVETSAKAANADLVDGEEADALKGAGFTAMPDTEIGPGGSHDIARFASISGATLEIERAGVANTSFNAPSGLTVLVYDHTNGTVLTSYNTTDTGNKNPPDTVDVGGINASIMLDNGEYGSGTGSTQQVTGHVTMRLV